MIDELFNVRVLNEIYYVCQEITNIVSNSLDDPAREEVYTVLFFNFWIKYNTGFRNNIELEAKNVQANTNARESFL